MVVQIDLAYQLLLIADTLTETRLGFAFYLTDVSFDNFAVNRDGKVIIVDLEDILVVDKAKIRRGEKGSGACQKYAEAETKSNAFAYISTVKVFFRVNTGKVTRQECLSKSEWLNHNDAVRRCVFRRHCSLGCKCFARVVAEKRSGWDEPVYSSYVKCLDGESDCTSYSPDDLCTHDVVDHNYYMICRNLLSADNGDPLHPLGLLHGVPSDVEAQWQLQLLVRECTQPLLPSGRLKVKDQLRTALEEIRKDHF